MWNNRLELYVKNIIHMSFASKTRLILTSLGIFISVFGFSMGILISDSYYESQKDYYNTAADNTVVIKSNQTADDVKKTLSSFTSVIPIDEVVVQQKIPIGSVQKKDGSYINILGTIHGVSSTEVFIQTSDKGYDIPSKNTILYGRGIYAPDISGMEPVVIIDMYTAELLFPDSDNYLEETIRLNSSVSGSSLINNNQSFSLELDVVGIKENSILTEHKTIENRKKIQQLDNTINIIVDIYCPISTVYNYLNKYNLDRSYIYCFETLELNQSFSSAVKAYSEMTQYQNITYEISTKEILLEEASKELNETKTIINIVMIGLCIVFGLSITSVVIFSVKERIPEIGIRKAFGADKLDIVSQILFEMIFISCIASTLAIVFSIIMSKIFELYMINRLFIYFKLHISIKNIITPLILGVVESATLGIIPGVYASNILITNALKFE